MRLHSKPRSFIPIFIQMSDADINELFLIEVFRRHPGARLGDRLLTPTQAVYDGKIHRNTTFDGVVYSLPTLPEPIPKPVPQVAKMVRKTIPLRDLENEVDLLDEELLSTLPENFFIHAYRATIPYRELLTKHVPGDTVMVVNADYEEQPHTLTEKDFDEMRIFSVEFGISTPP